VGAIAGRGSAYRQLARYDEALADLNRAIEQQADSAKVLAARGQTYRLMGRYEEALSDLEHAVELDHTQDWTRYQYALALHASGQEEAARDALKICSSLASDRYHDMPSNWLNAFNLVIYRAAHGDTANAKALLHEILLGSVPASAIWTCLEDLKEFLAVAPDRTDVSHLIVRVRAALETRPKS
jgi:tetratricopeptide (TPR) repeat protein